MRLSRKITLFGFLLAICWGKSYACPYSSSRVEVAFATLTLSIPKDLIVDLDVDNAKHNQVPISLKVLTVCMNLKLLGPGSRTEK